MATPTDIQLALLVRECITAANYKAWPTTLDEWHDVASRLGISVQAVSFNIGGACLLDNLLLYQTGTDECVARYFAHELSESRLRCECEAPFILEDHEGACHRISQLLEHGPQMLHLRSIK